MLRNKHELRLSESSQQVFLYLCLLRINISPSLKNIPTLKRKLKSNIVWHTRHETVLLSCYIFVRNYWQGSKFALKQFLPLHNCEEEEKIGTVKFELMFVVLCLQGQKESRVDPIVFADSLQSFCTR